MSLLDLQHANMVANLVKSGDDIKQELLAHQAHLLHMAVGISGEAGELLDAIKKHCIYQKPLDMANVIEELGDLEFYMCGLRESLEITRGQTLQANITKLSQRYAKGTYSNEAAIERSDKHE